MTNGLAEGVTGLMCPNGLENQKDLYRTRNINKSFFLSPTLPFTSLWKESVTYASTEVTVISLHKGNKI